jgi:hypothetical protein
MQKDLEHDVNGPATREDPGVDAVVERPEDQEDNACGSRPGVDGPEDDGEL